MSNLYWLSDEEWSRIEPLLPRGRRGAHRVDDHRVISGTVAIDSSYIKAHRSAAGGKGGRSTKPSGARAAGEPPRSTR
jgi:hypothetical protein